MPSTASIAVLHIEEPASGDPAMVLAAGSPWSRLPGVAASRNGLKGSLDRSGRHSHIRSRYRRRVAISSNMRHFYNHLRSSRNAASPHSRASLRSLLSSPLAHTAAVICTRPTGHAAGRCRSCPAYHLRTPRAARLELRRSRPHDSLYNHRGGAGASLRVAALPRHDGRNSSKSRGLRTRTRSPITRGE